MVGVAVGAGTGVAVGVVAAQADASNITMRANSRRVLNMISLLVGIPA
jgi:hypothetical protein